MKSLKGQLLIAAPGLASTFFSRTVILMLEHGEDGATGVVLNRPTEATVTDIAEPVLSEPFEWGKTLNLGGPVSGPLMVLHRAEDLADEQIVPGVFHTVEDDKVREMIRERVEPSLILVNYAGWGPGQLEGEFDVESWLTLPATVDHVFWAGRRELWDVVVKAVNARRLSDFLGLREVPADPNLN